MVKGTGGAVDSAALRGAAGRGSRPVGGHVAILQRQVAGIEDPATLDGLAVGDRQARDRSTARRCDFDDAAGTASADRQLAGALGRDGEALADFQFAAGQAR